MSWTNRKKQVVNMAINFDKALGVYESALRLRAQRAEVLSSNLVNVDTPNFKARDFNFHQALSQAVNRQSSGADIVQTQNQHLGSGSGVPGLNSLAYRTPSQPSIDGNTVDEHMEHAEFMSNNLEFQTSFTLLNGRFKSLLSAIRGE
jgi:flagellar basal-body rod protein FlgB